MNKYRLTLGTIFWVLALACLVILPFALSQNSWIRSFGRIHQYVTAQRQEVVVNIKDDDWIVRVVEVGDPVYTKTEYGMKKIGQVVSKSISDTDGGTVIDSVTITLYGDAPPVTRNCFITLHQTPLTFDWAFQHLFPEKRRQEIMQDLKEQFELHQADIIEEFTPILLDTLKEVSMVLQEDLKQAFQEKKDQLTKIGARYQEGFVEQKLIPLIKREIWPIVERRAQPVLDEVGSEIWQKASLWRFGWRLAYDKFPLTNSNLLKQEWNRFVKDDAMPVVESHSDDFYQLARNILREIAENPEVKQAGKEGINQLLNDEEIKQLISETLWKILFENDRLKAVIRRNLSSQRTLDVVKETSGKFEDKLREIGDNIFGTFEDGIRKEFAGLLRKEILRRDLRWFVLRYSSYAEDDRLEIASEIDGFFSPNADDRPEFVRYGNEK